MPKIDIGQITPVKGVDYWTPEDEQKLNDSIAAANAAKAISEARAASYVFDTEAEMNTWLSVADNKAKLNIGDNLYIRATDVPDYWWDGTNVCIMETLPVDLSDYIKRSDVDMMIDDLRDEQFAAISDFKTMPLQIKALEDDCVFSNKNANLEISLDEGETWQAYSSEITLSKGQRLSLRSTGTNYVKFAQYFSISKRFKVYGNPMSLTRGASFVNAMAGTTINNEFRFFFQNCTTLVSAKYVALTATTLTKTSCEQMFSGCTALVYAPELPATTLAQSCYIKMFQGCTSLVNAPELPATTLADHCYNSMFYYCTSLVDAPELPATTLAKYCYYLMFYGCTSLVNAPALPATTLASDCYSNMFSGCHSLVNVPALPATTLAPSCYSNMFSGCNSLVNVPALPATTLGSCCYKAMFYYCTSLVDAPELPATTLAEQCYNSMFQGCTSLVNAPALPVTTLASDCYGNMFRGCTSLVNAPELPATTLVEYCYQQMFFGCTSLVNAPELPATTLAEQCYNSMFSGCTSLVDAPALPATTLAGQCYYMMFDGCTSLVNAPELPATTLGYSCYYSMFSGCTSLVNAPALPATTLALRCYRYMFNGCEKVTYVKINAVDIPYSNSVENMLRNASPNGILVKNYMSTIDLSVLGAPSGWIMKDSYTPTVYKSMTITAVDVSWNATTTAIHCEFVTDGVDDLDNPVNGVILTEKAVSEPFEQNMLEEPVQRTITHSAHGLTASCVITQSAWVASYIDVDLNNEWTDSTKTLDGYDVYMSNSNKGVNSSRASMKVTFNGHTDFKLYLNSFAESDYDYAMIWEMDSEVPTGSISSSTAGVKAHTRGNQKDPTTIDNFTEVSYPNDGDEHFVWVTFIKDNSDAANDDRAYVAIPRL